MSLGDEAQASSTKQNSVERISLQLRPNFII
jgi:hypothetical protein